MPRIPFTNLDAEWLAAKASELHNAGALSNSDLIRMMNVAKNIQKLDDLAHSGIRHKVEAAKRSNVITLADAISQSEAKFAGIEIKKAPPAPRKRLSEVEFDLEDVDFSEIK